MISLKSKISCAVLADLFLHEHRSFYMNECARRLGLDSGNLSRKLKEFETTGLLRSQMRGKERYYSLNPSFPLLHEYRKIILKTIGIEAQIRSALKEVAGIERSFLFGSYAAGRMDETSDIDLVVIGNHGTLDLQRKIAFVQKKLSREINLISISPREYEKKKKDHPFFKALERRPRVELI